MLLKLILTIFAINTASIAQAGGAGIGGTGQIADLSINGEIIRGYVIENDQYASLINEVYKQGIELSDFTVSWETVSLNGLKAVWNPSTELMESPYNNMTGIMFPNDTNSAYPSMVKYLNEEGSAEYYLPESSIKFGIDGFLEFYTEDSK